MPITLSGRVVTAAISVIGIDDVFEAIMVCADIILSSFIKRSVFTAMSSTTASIIKSQLALSAKFVDGLYREKIAFLSWSVILYLVIDFINPSLIRLKAFSSTLGFTSCKTTSNPD